MYRLFLDDIRTPESTYSYIKNPIYKEKWIIVRSYNEFVSYITENGIPSLISFDHDLADMITDDVMTEKTGYHCAKWLIEYCIDNKINPPDYLVHSMNTAGASNIKYLIENYKKFLNK